jgi:hypothetical protein
MQGGFLFYQVFALRQTKACGKMRP